MFIAFRSFRLLTVSIACFKTFQPAQANNLLFIFYHKSGSLQVFFHAVVSAVPTFALHHAQAVLL